MGVVQSMMPWVTLVDDETREVRYSTCKACDKFTVFKTCSLCDCIMPAKTLWADAECPEGKWGKETSDTTTAVDGGDSA